MSFANPWGLLGLLALPAILVIHLYHRRFPPLLVAGLHLWSAEIRQHQAGRKRERLPISGSLVLELLAALVLTLVLSEPRWNEGDNSVHVVAVLDNSASMQTRPPGEKLSCRDRAIDTLRQRLLQLPRNSRLTVILTGPNRVEKLVGPALWQEAEPALANWQPALPRHAFEPAWDEAVSLAGDRTQFLFLTDKLLRNQELPTSLELIALGEPAENLAIAAARWHFDGTTGKGSVFLRLHNHGRRSHTCQVTGQHGETTVFRQEVTLAADHGDNFEVPVPGGLQDLVIELSSPEDALALDNRVYLVEPQVRTVTIAQTLPQGSATKALSRALKVIPQIQMGDVESAHLVIAPGGELPPSNPRLWWLGVGPLSTKEADRKGAKVLVGPFVLEKSHRLLEGVTLQGVTWGGVQPVTLDAAPLVSAGPNLLLGQLAGTRTTAFLMNIDFDISTLANSPDFPIFLQNLIDARRDALPGLQRWNYRIGETVRLRLYDSDADPVAQGKGPLQRVFQDKTALVPRRAEIELFAPEGIGIHELRDGEATLARFAVNFQDSRESDLRELSTGIHSPKLPEIEYGLIRVDQLYSWLILGGIAVILACIILDWVVLRGRTAPQRAGGVSPLSPR